MRVAQREQGERQADVVVEVSPGVKNALLARVLAQDRGQHLFDGGLAVRPGHGDERGSEARAPVARQVAERAPRVADHQRRQRIFAAVGAVDHGGGGFGRDALQELMPVEALAAQRDEQIALADRAAVGGNAAERDVTPAHAAAERGCRFAERHHAGLRASAFFACSASENSLRRPRTSW